MIELDWGDIWRRYLLFGEGIWRRYLGKVFGGGTMTFEKMGWTTATRIKFKITLHYGYIRTMKCGIVIESGIFWKNPKL